MRIDLRCIATGAMHVAFLVFVFILTPIYGLQGVAVAQVLQAAGLLLVAWWLLKRQLPSLPIVPYRWNGKVLREMMGYGLSFQAISVMSMLFDPVAKALMSKFGGLEALGFYEMANKLILQARSLIVESGRFLVPSIAAMSAADSDKAREIFVTSYRVIFYVAVIFYGLLGIALTGISLIWMGRYEQVFVQFALILNAGWFVNTLVVPAYFANLGFGRLRANVVSHAIIGVVAAVGGSVLGVMFGSLGVLVGTTLGLVAGSLFLSIGHIVASGLNWTRFIVPSGTAGLLAVSVGLALFSNGYGTIDHSLLSVLITSLCCAGLLILMGWFNPMRTWLLIPRA
jgi:O-antigen/teichoic acid export membrane protein